MGQVFDLKTFVKGVILIGLTVAVASCNSPSAQESPVAPPKAELTKIEGLSRYALAQPVSYGNVSLVPIVDVSKQTPGQVQSDYLSLAEAKKLGLISIQEIPGNAEVNTLIVKNLGKKPILLLAGELLLGGQQDRIVAQDTIVPPGATMKVPAFCVEPDRWEGPTKNFEGSGAMVPQSVRKEATYGDQQAVWAKVKTYNGAVAGNSGVTVMGSSVRGGLSSKEVQSRIDADLPKFKNDLAKMKNVVGFVTVMNGVVQTAELFGDAKLCKAGQEGLLKGILADAAVAETDPRAKLSMDDCASFLKDVMAGKRNRSAKREGNFDYSVSGTNVVGKEASVNAAPAEFEGRDGAAGFVHGTYSKKVDTGK